MHHHSLNPILSRPCLAAALAAVLLSLGGGGANVTRAADGDGKASPAAGLPRSTPEAQGIASAAIRGFIEAADEQIDTLHSFMLVRHGQVI
ncbi:MAG: hypothetical protein KDL87_11535, partial [Verrucomicrobiae bacterium]|nr:hypothetical protein [Verrucomicrobiae bacterium]